MIRQPCLQRRSGWGVYDQAAISAKEEWVGSILSGNHVYRAGVGGECMIRQPCLQRRGGWGVCDQAAMSAEEGRGGE
jgi:hypothetical protein